MTVQKYLKEIRDNITWSDEYFDKYFRRGKHFTKNFIIQYDYNPRRRYKVKTWGGLLTHLIQIEDPIQIFKISKADSNGILVLTIQESHPMWKKFAFRLNRLEKARNSYKDRLGERTLLRVLEAEHIVSTKEDESEYGIHVTLGGNHIIILEDEAEVAHHLLRTK